MSIRRNDAAWQAKLLKQSEVKIAHDVQVRACREVVSCKTITLKNPDVQLDTLWHDQVQPASQERKSPQTDDLGSGIGRAQFVEGTEGQKER